MNNQVIFNVTHSCGDCGFVSGATDFDQHHQGEWHKLVMRVGLKNALNSPTANLPDARRAVTIFQEGTNQ